MVQTALRESKTRGQAMVEAEAHYYSVKERETYRLREDGEGSTFIALVIKGRPEVNEALLDYRAREVEYNNAKEAVNVYKKRLDTLREQYAREWGQAGRSDRWQG